jgi:hypothetical protein
LVRAAWFTAWAARLLRALLARQIAQNRPVTMVSPKRHSDEGVALPGRG